MTYCAQASSLALNSNLSTHLVLFLEDRLLSLVNDSVPVHDQKDNELQIILRRATLSTLTDRNLIQHYKLIKLGIGYLERVKRNIKLIFLFSFEKLKP